MPPKKNVKKQKDDDWDDDAAEKKLAAIKLKEEKETNDNWDDDEVASSPPRKPANKGKFGFAAMMDESDDDASAKSDSDPESEPVAKKPEIKKQEKVEKKEVKKEDNKKKTKKGKKGKQADDEDDLDALLADIEKPTEKTEPKKEIKQETPKEEDAKEKENEDDAADGDAKKKKKKKKKDKKKGEDDGEPDAVETPSLDQEKKDEDEDDEEEQGEGGETEDKKKKKKKDKKKDKKKEKEADDGKPKKKKHVDMIKELLRARQEAEEAEAKRIKEEEERLEALQKAKEEEARIERERKEAEKLRKKQAIERQKEAGTYLTAKEKEKARNDALKLAAAGINLQTVKEAGTSAEKRPIIYQDKRSKAKAEKLAQKKREEAASVEALAPTVPVSSVSISDKGPSPTDESVLDEKSDDEPLDDWEMAEQPETTEAASANLPSVAAVQPIPTIKAGISPASANIPTEGPKKEASEEVSDESSSEEESSSDDESSANESSEDEGPKGKETKEEIRERVKRQLKKRREIAEAKRSTDHLRAPVICVMGHVDTGKTKMLDTIRRTNVQDNEAGGITQQIGATQVPADAIKERCKQVRDFVADTMKIPGFLVIDTPGHESFSNLRSRGSSLCDFAILVVDIMHGLEPQTIESLKMLLKRQTPFVVALNKIDRLYGYESNPRKDVYQHLKSQPQYTQLEFTERYNKVVTEFAEQGLNVILSNKNKNREEYISMVPTSAYHGDGIGNLMAYIVDTTQNYYAEKLAFCEELDASVMEVKAIPGLGTTIDVILVNGMLRVGDFIVLTGSDGPISTQIRDLLMPPALREIRVKTEFDHYKMLKAAQGVKILAKGLEKAVAGLPMFVVHKEEELDILREEAEAQLSKALHAIKKKPEGVYVQASTLGSLEALLEFLKTQKIPYSNVNIGPVHKKDIQKAAAMKEHNSEYACILAFDVKVERDAQIFADHEGVKVFQADIIYHLEDSFLKYREDLRLQARKENEHKAIFPCKLRILPQCIFNARNPIVIGVVIESGQLKKGTPICVPSKECIALGAVASIERNHEEVPLAKKGEEVCIKIENTTGEAPKLYGRHFTHEDTLVSKITRESIDVCKTHFRDDLSREDWQLVVALKKSLDIM